MSWSYRGLTGESAADAEIEDLRDLVRGLATLVDDLLAEGAVQDALDSIPSGEPAKSGMLVNVLGMVGDAMVADAWKTLGVKP